MDTNSVAGQLARRRPGRGPLRRAARAVSAIFSAGAVVAAAMAAAPAIASTAPSMNTVGNDTNIAVQGPNHSLHFYWAINGIAGWHPEKVAGAGTTYSAPSMLDSDSEVIIAVQGPNHSLVLYWAANGVAGWNRVQAAGPGTTYSAPSMTTATTTVSDFLFVTAEGPGHSLHLYWQFFDGGLGPSFPGFNDELVAPAGTTYSAPSILAASGDVLISAQGASHSLILYWQPIHGTGWSPEQLGNPASIYSATSMTTASGSYVFISAEGPSHQPYWYAVRPGSFGWNFLGGGIPAIGATAYAAPSITATSDGVLIAAEAASHRLQFWSSTDSGNTWNSEPAAAAGTTYSAPSMTTNSAGTIISAAGPGGSLDFYWQLFGATTWNPEQVAPPGSVG